MKYRTCNGPVPKLYRWIPVKTNIYYFIHLLSDLCSYHNIILSFNKGAPSHGLKFKDTVFRSELPFPLSTRTFNVKAEIELTDDTQSLESSINSATKVRKPCVSGRQKSVGQYSSLVFKCLFSPPMFCIRKAA